MKKVIFVQLRTAMRAKWLRKAAGRLVLGFSGGGVKCAERLEGQHSTSNIGD